MVKTNWNQGWQFSKDSISVEGGASVLKQGSWEAVNLPPVHPEGQIVHGVMAAVFLYQMTDFYHYLPPKQSPK